MKRRIALALAAAAVSLLAMGGVAQADSQSSALCRWTSTSWSCI